MSCTQFHCIKMFILRHAWLNLWDKHMTTGRINQVTFVGDNRNKHICTDKQRSWGSRYVVTAISHSVRSRSHETWDYKVKKCKRTNVFRLVIQTENRMKFLPCTLVFLYFSKKHNHTKQTATVPPKVRMLLLSEYVSMVQAMVQWT
jgi:hypothetical protein